MAAWLQQAARLGPWRDSAGRRVAVIYPGRWTGLPGPDLRDAIVSVDDGPALRLDLEAHLDGADWWRHGHHDDPAYAAVGLHLVWEVDAAPRGPAPPAIALARVLPMAADSVDARPTAAAMTLPCHGPHPLDDATRGLIVQAIERQGGRRHAEKTAVMESNIAALGPDQALHLAMLRALGYRQNAKPFEALGGCVTSGLAEALTSTDDGAGPGALEAVLMGAAGLLPMQRGAHPVDGYGRLLQRIWQSYGALTCLRAGDWTFQSVRPANRPTRRVAAAARLLAGAPNPGQTLVATVLAEVRRAATGSDLRRLQARFQVSEPVDAYWARRYDFGRPARRPAPALVGASRVHEILVNAVLPFAAAMGHVRGRPDLTRASADILAALQGGMWNQDSRYMVQTLGIGRRGLGGARAQQGLLRLFRRWCRDKHCGACPMARCVATPGLPASAVS